MTAALSPRSILPGEIHENGIALPPDLTFEEWSAALSMAEMIERASPWWVVDLMAYGRDHFGDDHSAALPTFEEDPTGIRQSKLKQAAWMADRWPTNTRVPGASYTHHRIVAKLDRDEAQSLLTVAMAATDQDGNPRPWSTRELAREVDARERAIAVSPDGAAVPACAADRWTPTKDDLLPEHRAALERAAFDADLDDPSGFTAGALWMARYTSSEALFREGHWIDE